MATEQENRGNSKLKYMELKGFADHKSKDKDFLRNYTMLEGINCVAPKSLITEADLEALKPCVSDKFKEPKRRSYIKSNKNERSNIKKSGRLSMRLPTFRPLKRL